MSPHGGGRRGGPTQGLLANQMRVRSELKQPPILPSLSTNDHKVNRSFRDQVHLNRWNSGYLPLADGEGTKFRRHSN